MVSRCIYAASQVYIILLFQHRLPGRSSGHQVWPLTAPQKQFNADDTISGWENVARQHRKPWAATVSLFFVSMDASMLISEATENTFYPRDAMLARVIVIAVCLSVRPSVTRRYCVKSKKASVMISSPSGSPKTLVLWRQISSPNSKGFPPNGSLKQGSVGKIQRFFSFKRQYLEKLADTAKVTISD